jgi:hypothetical protein
MHQAIAGNKPLLDFTPKYFPIALLGNSGKKNISLGFL